jgi:hypothetical protein
MFKLYPVLYTQVFVSILGLTNTAFVLGETPAPTEIPALTNTEVIIAIDEKAGDEHDDAYYAKLLGIALEKTVPTYGPYTIRTVPFIYVDKRLLQAVEKNKVTVTWRHHQKNYNRLLLPIKMNLLKELSDYRVLLIRQNEQSRFSTITSLDDLRKLKGGMGAHWPDRVIMEKNDLPLVFSVNYFHLFNMLAKNRFDYLSRGIYQILPELEVNAKKGLVLEQHLLLHYKNPMYYYVNKKNTLLAKRIEEGLKLAIADGSFDQAFHHFPRFTWAQDIIKNSDRIVLTLKP